jgi:hypothetical protein
MYISWFYIDQCNWFMEQLGHGICVFRVDTVKEGGYQLTALCQNPVNNAVFTSGICADIETCIRQILGKLKNAFDLAKIA